MDSGTVADLPTILRAAVEQKRSLLLVEPRPGFFTVIPMDQKERSSVRAYITACGVIVESVMAKKDNGFSLPALPDDLLVVRV